MSPKQLMIGLPIAAMLSLTACGAAAAGGPPEFVQAYGGIDAPCAASAPATTTIQHCVARVVLTNQGGEGYGHVTVGLQLKGATDNVPLVRCGASVPDTATGAHADLVCAFDLPAGETIVSYPIVKSIDFVGASGRSAPDNSTSLASLTLTAATALLALAALVLVVAARGRRSAPVAEPAAPGEAGLNGHVAQPEPAQPAGADAQYELPQLPR